MGDLINIPSLLSSLAGFLILWFVLKKFAFGPVLQIIDDRRDSIEAAFKEVDDARAEVSAMKSEYEQSMARINAEAQAKLQEALDQGKALSEQLRAEAEAQREKLLAKTHEDIQREKDKALAELRNEAIDLSFALATKALQGGLDKSVHDKLVADFVRDIKELN
jgi:F-type H+-transporting ATPase subunit b